MNTAYELTRPTVKTIQYGGQMMGMCPKCAKVLSVEPGKVKQCEVCGMLFQVKHG